MAVGTALRLTIKTFISLLAHEGSIILDRLDCGSFHLFLHFKSFITWLNNAVFAFRKYGSYLVIIDMKIAHFVEFQPVRIDSAKNRPVNPTNNNCIWRQRVIWGNDQLGVIIRVLQARTRKRRTCIFSLFIP